MNLNELIMDKNDLLNDKIINIVKLHANCSSFRAAECTDAIFKLLTDKERSQPLTWMQLQEMNGQAVWCDTFEKMVLCEVRKTCIAMHGVNTYFTADEYDIETGRRVFYAAPPSMS